MIKLFNRPKNVRLIDYAHLKPKVKELVDYTVENSVKENPILKVGRKKVKPKQFDFWQLSWNDIVLLRHHLKDNDIEACLKLIYSISDSDFIKLQIFNCSACYKWIASKIKEINEIENANLGEEPSEEDKAAGVEKLEPFGFSVSLEQLTKGDSTKEDYYLNQPYAKIFKKRCLQKTLTDIQIQKNKNASSKTKRNNRNF